jgi:hypothetical protein
MTRRIMTARRPGCGPAARSRPRTGQLAAEDADPFPEPGQPVAGIAVVLHAGPFGEDRNVGAGLGIGDRDHGPDAGRMLHRVRQPLLHHPVGGQLGAADQQRRRALGPVFDRLTGRADPFHQVAQLTHHRLAVGRGGRVEHAQQVPQLAERLPAGLADVLQARGHRGRVGLELGRVGLHDDRGDVVGDHVVQLAGDPGPLVGHRGRGPRLLPFPLPGLAGADPVAEQPRDGQHDGEGDEVEAGLGGSAGVQGDRQRDIADERDQTHDPPAADVVESDQQAQAGDGRPIAEQLIGREGHRDDGEDRHRPAAASRQRQALGERQHRRQRVERAGRGELAQVRALVGQPGDEAQRSEQEGEAAVLQSWWAQVTNSHLVFRCGMAQSRGRLRHSQ